MITITINNELKPVKIAEDKWDTNVLFERKVYFLGVRIYKYRCDKTIDTEFEAGTRTKKKGFITVKE